jgi:type IV secretion system protein VirB4
VITAITSVTALLAVVLVLLLAARIRAVGGERQLKKHRATDESLADLLVHASMVSDGVVVGKNGAFMAAWLYRGADHASSDEESMALVSIRINQALARLGSGWMIHVDSARRAAPGYPARQHSAFADPVSAAIDEERRRYFAGRGTMFEGFFVLTVTWFPPMLAERKFIELMFDDDTVAPGNAARSRALLDQFERECDALQNRLSASLSLQRLRANPVGNEEGGSVLHDEFLRWLQYCVTGLNHPVVLSSNPSYLDALIGGQEFWTGVIPRIGRHFVQVVAIEGFPLESTPGMLSVLAELPGEYRWSNRFIFMDQHEALAHLDKYRKKWRQKVRGFFDQVFNTNTGAVDQDAMAMVGDAEAAMAEVNSGLVAMGYYTSVVVMMDTDRARLEASAQAVEKAINAKGFTARVETINTVEAFLGSVPGHGVENVRRPLINTLNLADLLPTSTIWTGAATAPCPMYPPGAPALMQCVTAGQTPFRLNLHVRDVGHTLVFGPTGSGKSTKLAIMLAQFRRYKGARIVAFDFGMSLYPICKGMGGEHYEIGGDDDRLAFAPLQHLSTRADRAWAMEWIDMLLGLNGLQTTAAQRNEIAKAVLSLHETGSKTLSNLHYEVQDNKMREVLEQYTADGTMGHLLDAESDTLALSDTMVFEIGELMGLGEKYALPVLLYLFRRIEMVLDGRPTLLVLDEAWLMLGHPVFRARIREWLKTLRKKNVSVVLATQNLSDAAGSGILDVLVESTATKVFLPNATARDEDASALYGRMGLNRRQIGILASAQPKRDYYFVSEQGRRLYSLALGPLALSFVGATSKEDVARIKALEREHGADWVNEWLRSRSVNIADYASA